MSADLFRELFDDASLFPPAALAMADAVSGHLRHQAAWYRATSGPFVCADARIPELSMAMTAAGVAELDLALVLPGGAAGLDPAVDSVFADPRLRLRAIELPVATSADTLASVSAAAAALDRTPLAGAAAFIEIPARQLTAEVARAVADHRYLAKVRTGGTTAEAFPDEPTLATCLAALVAERLPFKCTAGLHHAVRHTATDTGFEHHGFLNVLLAVAAALTSDQIEEVTAELADSAAGRVAAKASDLAAGTVTAVRDLFTSFGTCSTDEPIADLVTLGLISADHGG
ncbi:MAG TPA: hypothetical protein VMA72_12895 [Streptosporangiaceae bacterium]|nr:hypothetical protein [Streptosporangiaceae bacterium]